MTWLYGDSRLAYIWNGLPYNIREKEEIYNTHAIRSRAFGISFDYNGVKNEVINCQAVQKEILHGLMSGELDPDIYLPLLQSRLKASGIDQIIKAKQEQLNEWIRKGTQ